MPVNCGNFCQKATPGFLLSELINNSFVHSLPLRIKSRDMLELLINNNNFVIFENEGGSAGKAVILIVLIRFE